MAQFDDRVDKQGNRVVTDDKQRLAHTENQFLYHFHSRLQNEVKSELMRINFQMTTIDELLQQLQRFEKYDSRRPAPNRGLLGSNAEGNSRAGSVDRKDSKSSSGGRKSDKGSRPEGSSGKGAAHTTLEKDSKKDKKPRMSDEEFNRRKNENCCFQCGQSGHMKLDCTNPSSIEKPKN